MNYYIVEEYDFISGWHYMNSFQTHKEVSAFVEWRKKYIQWPIRIAVRYGEES